MRENRNQQSYWQFILISVYYITCLISPRFHKDILLRLISLSLAKFAGFVCPLCPLCVRNCRTSPQPTRTCRFKSIKVDQSRSKSIITKNCVIDFYRHPIFVDWLVSNLIDNDRLLSTIEIIDMLRPDYLKFNCWIPCHSVPLLFSLVGVLWRTKQNTIDAILIQWDANKWQGIQ